MVAPLFGCCERHHMDLHVNAQISDHLHNCDCRHGLSWCSMFRKIYSRFFRLTTELTRGEFEPAILAGYIYTIWRQQPSCHNLHYSASSLRPWFHVYSLILPPCPLFLNIWFRNRAAWCLVGKCGDLSTAHWSHLHWKCRNPSTTSRPASSKHMTSSQYYDAMLGLNMEVGTGLKQDWGWCDSILIQCLYMCMYIVYHYFMWLDMDAKIIDIWR